jgi:hypothetical protein
MKAKIILESFTKSSKKDRLWSWSCKVKFVAGSDLKIATVC